MVKDKINYRALGPRTALTRQPVSGRANDGGLRIGEMERDGVISHGATAFLRESMMERGDKYKLAICNTTGQIAIYNSAKNLFMSPLADGPIKFTDTVDSNNMSIETVTKFGRKFSLIEVPYSFKLLMQELQTINVQMRLITDDNIDQFDSMNYSNNIKLLTKDILTSPDSIITAIKQNIRDKTKTNIQSTPESIQSTPESIQSTAESIQSTPEATNTEVSPEYAPDSLSYQPTQEEKDRFAKEQQDYYAANPDSPLYNPFTDDETSPVYNPNSTSPQYPPNSRPPSPDYPPDQQMMSGGNKYNVGDSVLFRGCSNPKQLWNIKNIGDKFITIHAEDSYGMDPNDKIKVVTMFDIYRPGDFSYNNDPSSQLYNSPVQPQQVVQVPETNSTPAINIKIVNGNDMTEQSGNDMIQQNDNNIVENNNNPLIKMNTQTEPDTPMPVNAVDFNGGMVIKKIP
jgi:hypothetical protein